MFFSHQAIRLFLLRIEQVFTVLFGLAGISINQYGSHLSGKHLYFTGTTVNNRYGGIIRSFQQ
jgi:hypothetical protein